MIRLEHQPLDVMKITSPFGMRDLLDMWWHNGIDLSAVIRTPVYAVASGIVQVSKNNPTGYGLYVVIEHTEYCTLSAHLSQLKVKVGQGVKSGDIIGYTGNTGTSTAPHLHFEIRECKYKDFWDRCKTDGNVFMRCVDPIPYVNRLNVENSLTVVLAEQIIQQMTGFDNNTMDYLSQYYKYSDAMLLKLAKALL